MLKFHKNIPTDHKDIQQKPWVGQGRSRDFNAFSTRFWRKIKCSFFLTPGVAWTPLPPTPEVPPRISERWGHLQIRHYKWSGFDGRTLNRLGGVNWNSTVGKFSFFLTPAVAWTPLPPPPGVPPRKSERCGHLQIRHYKWSWFEGRTLNRLGGEPEFDRGNIFGPRKKKTKNKSH